MKYEFTGEIKVEFGITLRRIRAAVAFRGIAKGDLGGFIEKEDNLSQAGNAWVSGNAQYLFIGCIGSRADVATFYRNKSA